MAFFTKQEIMQRMIEKRAEIHANPARADLNLALIILGSALFEKRLWSGRDYGEHPLHVGMRNTRSVEKMIIGLLHDVVEDSDWTVDDLRTVGFSERVVAGVDSMTHREGELYFDSIERCSLNLDGTDKKIEDLSHNMDSSRAEKIITEKDMSRINKYIVSRSYLVAIKKGEIERGSSIIDFVNAHAEFKKSTVIAQLLASNSSRTASPAQTVTPTPSQPALKP